VTGVGTGVVNIYYSIGGCYAYKVVTVNAAAYISGSSTVCVGGTTTLTGGPTGGSWISSSTGIATVSSTGVVTGVAAGVTTITYAYTPGGCIATKTVTVSAGASISGSSTACVGGTTTLTGTPSGGTWTSSALGIATITSGGVVTGVAPGTTTIYYSAGGCYAYRLETVNPAPVSLVGPSEVCVGSTITLTDAVSGGAWTSSNTAVATVSSSGVVTGMSAGTVNIYYTIGSCSVSRTIIVDPAPAAITGPTSVLVTYSIVLSDATTGGSWLSSSPSIATVGALTGIVTGVSAGSVNIYYTVGGCSVARTITVSEVPFISSPAWGAPTAKPGISATASSEGSMSVYPNPTSGRLNIQWENQTTGDAEVQISDVTGHEVYRSALQISDVSGQAQLSLDNLTDGIYLIRIRSANTYYSSKLQVLR